MRRRPRFNWARPRRLGDFACQWEYEVRAARSFGSTVARGRYLELRYEDLVADPDRRLREVCGFLGLGFEPEMLEYHRGVDPSTLQDHPRLEQPPIMGLRDWREQMAPRDVERFEAVAGPLLAELGYPRAYPVPSSAAQAWAALERAAFQARLASWRSAVALVRRSPVWRLRQVYVRRAA
jgi:hypothetical protein